MERAKVTVKRLREMKAKKEKIAALSSYDFPMTQAMERAGADLIFIGDSLATAVLGHANAVGVTMEEMLHHCKAVSAAGSKAIIVGDMPFGSYNESKEQAVRNANRFMKEGGVDAVLLEGGGEFVAEVTAAMVKSGIPVMTVLGVNPQTMHLQSGLEVRGQTAEEAFEILQEALAIEAAGAFAFELLFVTEQLAKAITERVSIPTIGIGSGRFCDGQLLLPYDLLGLRPWFTARFAKRYANLSELISKAFTDYVGDVHGGAFPQKEHGFSMVEEEDGKLQELIRSKL